MTEEEAFISLVRIIYYPLAAVAVLWLLVTAFPLIIDYLDERDRKRREREWKRPSTPPPPPSKF